MRRLSIGESWLSALKCEFVFLLTSNLRCNRDQITKNMRYTDLTTIVWFAYAVQYILDGSNRVT